MIRACFLSIFKSSMVMSKFMSGGTNSPQSPPTFRKLGESESIYYQYFRLLLPLADSIEV
jgi:hypothetical protein